MFDFNKAIEEWRRELKRAGITSAEVLDELESHLRDDVEQQVCSGADAERAFELARQRIGPAAELRKELAKFGSPKSTWHLTFWPSFYYSCAGIAIMADVWTLVSFDLSFLERVAGVGTVASFVWYLVHLPFSHWRSSNVASPRFLSILKLMGWVVPMWTLWALLAAIRLVQIEIGIIPTMIMWSLCAAYALTVLVLGVNDAHSRGYGAGGWPSAPLCPVPGPRLPGGWCGPSFNIPVPPNRSFTVVGQKALELAHDEAVRLGHDYIGTEHLLLGMLRVAGGAMAQLLERNQVRGDAVRGEIERLVSPLPPHPSACLLPFTPRARKALQFAGKEAATLKSPLIRPEHVLLGLLREGSGVAAIALRNLGVQLKRTRAELAAITPGDRS